MFIKTLLIFIFEKNNKEYNDIRTTIGLVYRIKETEMLNFVNMNEPIANVRIVSTQFWAYHHFKALFQCL